LKLYAPSA